MAVHFGPLAALTKPCGKASGTSSGTLCRNTHTQKSSGGVELAQCESRLPPSDRTRSHLPCSERPGQRAQCNLPPSLRWRQGRLNLPPSLRCRQGRLNLPPSWRWRAGRAVQCGVLAKCVLREEDTLPRGLFRPRGNNLPPKMQNRKNK